MLVVGEGLLDGRPVLGLRDLGGIFDLVLDFGRQFGRVRVSLFAGLACKLERLLAIALFPRHLGVEVKRLANAVLGLRARRAGFGIVRKMLVGQFILLSGLLVIAVAQFLASGRQAGHAIVLQRAPAQAFQGLDFGHERVLGIGGGYRRLCARGRRGRHDRGRCGRIGRLFGG